MPIQFGGPGATPSLGNLVSTTLELQSGQTWIIPSGRWAIKPGKYTSIQEYDPITTIWRTIGAGSSSAVLEVIFSDGVNYRLANQTGCPVGAVVTNAGTGLTAPPAVTPSAGGSKWVAVVGGAISTSVTVSNGGSGYTYPPMVIFSAPPSPGVPASGYCTLSAGAVASVTVIDQGAGYTTPPTVTFVNDPREGLNATTIGVNAAAVCTLTGSGTVTALLCTDHGTGGQTAVPTFTFVPASTIAATAIMCWSITAYTVSTTTAGSGYTATVILSGYDTPPGSSVLLNPTIQSALVKGRNAFLLAALSAGALTATGQTVKDGGIYTAAPTMYVVSQGVFGAGAVQAVFTAATMGGQFDISTITPT